MFWEHLSQAGLSCDVLWVRCTKCILSCDSFNLRVMGLLVCKSTINQEPSVEETEVACGVWPPAFCELSQPSLLNFSAPLSGLVLERRWQRGPRNRCGSLLHCPVTGRHRRNNSRQKKVSLHLLNKEGQYQERRESVENHRSYFKVKGWETVV